MSGMVDLYLLTIFDYEKIFYHGSRSLGSRLLRQPIYTDN